LADAPVVDEVLTADPNPNRHHRKPVVRVFLQRGAAVDHQGAGTGTHEKLLRLDIAFTIFLPQDVIVTFVYSQWGRGVILALRWI
jgi:hypothetical protein